MRILVINLDRSQDRLAHMTKALGELGLAFERFPAVDGKALSPAECDAFERSHRRDVSWRPGEIGNFVSHIRVWERITAEPDDWWLILEDDAKLSPALPEFIQHFPEANLPPETLLKIETMGNKVLLSRRPVCAVGGISVHRLRSPHMGTAGYFAGRRAGAILAAQHERIKNTIDGFWLPEVARALGTSLYQTVPALVIQDAADKEGSSLGLDSLVDTERSERDRPSRSLRARRWLSKPLSRRLAIGRRQRIPFSR
jgi:glycosyl transferase family 25